MQKLRSSEQAEDFHENRDDIVHGLLFEGSKDNEFGEVVLVHQKMFEVAIRARLKVNQVHLAPRVEVCRENQLHDDALLHLRSLQLAFLAQRQELRNSIPRER